MTSKEFEIRDLFKKVVGSCPSVWSDNSIRKIEDIWEDAETTEKWKKVIKALIDEGVIDHWDYAYGEVLKSFE